jgi:hypothetical protein
MRLRLFRGRAWWPGRDQRGRPPSEADGQVAAQQSRQPDAQQPRQPAGYPRGARGSHRKSGRARVQTEPELTTSQDRASAGQNGWPVRDGPAPSGTAARGPARHATSAHAPGSAQGAARAAIRIAPEAGQATAAAVAPSTAASRQAGALREAAGTADAQPWYATVRPGRSAAGQRNCGCLEDVLVREWAADEEPAAEAVTAISRLAALPLLIKEKLAAGLDAIHVGSGGVPDLDHMGELAGVPLPSGRATWDACAGAYGERKIVVGSRPSPTPDVMCHEVGHALDDIDGAPGEWQSDSSDFRTLYARCLPHIASEFHRHASSLGRREFFADAFAAIASSQRPALVEMLSGDTRTALDVMLYFNVRYGM